MVQQLTNTQKVRVRLKPFTNRLGGEAAIDGKPEWHTDNSDLVALTPDEDGMACLIQTVGPPGACLVEATADVDLGDGFEPLTFTGEIDVIRAKASAGGLEFDAPEER